MVDKSGINDIMSCWTVNLCVSLPGHIHISTENTHRLLFDFARNISYTCEAHKSRRTEGTFALEFRKYNPCDGNGRETSLHLGSKRKQSNLCAIIRLTGIRRVEPHRHEAGE